MDRKAARAEWKETKPDSGIYALHVGGRMWVGASPRLSAAENQWRFTLTSGSARLADVAAAYAEAGSFRFEVLERLDGDLSAMARQTQLKERLAHWRQQTGAGAL